MRLPRPLITLSVLVAGAVVGVAVGWWGRGLEPAPVLVLPTIGKIQVLRLPLGARSLEGIQSFIIELSGVDDFARVYLNNYLVADRELGTSDVPNAAAMSKETSALFAQARTPRGNFGLGPFEGKMFLVRGRNYIVAELENSPYGPCSAHLNIKVNDIPPVGFPVIMGEGFEAEGGAALNQNVRKRLLRDGPWWLSYATCSRRIFEFDLY
jgi:hypothetical protein